MRQSLFLGLCFCFSAWGDQPIPVRPLAFEPTERLHEYVSRGPGYSLRATLKGVDLTSGATSPVHLSLAGARRLEPRPAGLMRSQSHYYVGPDPSSWRIGVPNYAQVRYESVYPGIDLVFHGLDRQFEYDFLIAPFADPRRIRMRLQGAGKATLNAAGDLVLLENGFHQHRPRILQEGSELPGGFKLNSDGTVSFRLGSYDHSKPLVIDPVITLATYLGGSWADRASDVAVDQAGNVYVTGYTLSPDFPGNGVFGQRPQTRQFGFVTKYAPVQNGKTAALFTIFLGDNASDYTESSAFAVRADSAGNIVVAGETNAPGFPLQNPIQSQIGGGLDCMLTDSSGHSHSFQCADAFLSKFTPDGRSLVFSTFYGGRLDNSFINLALDSEDNIYASGTAQGPTDLNGTAGAVQPKAGNPQDLQVVRFSPEGKLLYSTYLGGTLDAFATSIAVESRGIVWIGAQTMAKDMPTTKNAYQPTFQAFAMVAYLARIDMNQSGPAGLTYATYFGDASGNTALNHLFLDSSGQVVFCGSAAVTKLPTTATAMQLYPTGAPQARVTTATFTAGDGYIARINPTLSGNAQVTYASFVGGKDIDEAMSCAADSNGYLVVAGRTASSDPFWTVGSPFPYKKSGDTYNSFVIRIDPTKAGGRVDSIWFGGVAQDVLEAMALDSHGNAYLTGWTLSQQFPVTRGAPQKVYGGDTLTLPNGGPVGPDSGASDTWMAQVNLNGPQTAVVALGADSGDFQFGAPGSILTNPLNVHLTDANGNILPLAGYPVTFTATNAEIVSSEHITDGTGLTGIFVQLNTGSATVTASLPPLTPYTFHVNAISGPLPKSVAIVSGDTQSGRAGAALPQPLVVELRDANQAPLALAGITVVFQANNVSLSAANVATDTEGRASTTVTLGTNPGAMSVTIIAGALPAVTANFTVVGPVISSMGVTNGATFLSGPVCPGLLVTIFGSNVGPATLTMNSVGVDSKFSTSLGNTRVLFDGVVTPLLYVSANQTAAIVPYGVAGKTSTQMVVEYQGIPSNTVTMVVADSQPGIFSSNSSGVGQGAIMNQDHSANSPTNPEKRNRIIQLYGVGGGATDPAGIDGLVASKVFPKLTLPVKVRIQGQDAEVLYAGAAPSLVAGILQVNVRIPAGTPDGNATVELFVGNNQSPPVITVAVKGD